MSSEETRSKRFQQRKRNIYAKELEKYRPKVIKPVTTYKRQNLKPQDVTQYIEPDESLDCDSKWPFDESEYDEQQTD